MADIDSVSATLYGLRPQEFIAERDAAVKAARAAGDRPLAAAIAALRKPAMSAWLMNLLVRHDGSLADQLSALADGLRAAEASLDGDQLRELNRQRRQLVASLAGQAQRLGAAAGQRVADSVVQELDRTLMAALADPDVTAEVLSGRLTGPREHVGFGAVGWGGPHLTIVADPTHDADPKLDADPRPDAEPKSDAHALAGRGRAFTAGRPGTATERRSRLTVVEPRESAAARQERERKKARAAAEASAREASERAQVALQSVQERLVSAREAQAVAEQELEQWQAMTATARAELETSEREISKLRAAAERSRERLADVEQRGNRASDELAAARVEAQSVAAAVRSAKEDAKTCARALARAARANGVP